MSTLSLGADLRALRKLRGMTLSELADISGRSVGWLSQVERDLSNLSDEDLAEMARIYKVPVSLLTDDTATAEVEQGRVVRAGNRRDVGPQIEGLSETLVSPDLTDSFEVIHSVFAAGSQLTSFKQRPTQEVGYIVSGKLDIYLTDDKFTVHSGDSFRIREERFRWANPYATAAIALWVISPPVY